jgi:hypothetical protein
MILGVVGFSGDFPKFFFKFKFITHGAFIKQFSQKVTVGLSYKHKTIVWEGCFKKPPLLIWIVSNV